MITTVSINGTPIDPGLVLAELTVLHGRRDILDGPTASSATVVVLHPPGAMPAWRGGDMLELAGPEGPAFTGRITERSLVHMDADGVRHGRFTVTAMGPVARLGVRTVGEEPWPAESGTERATRILEASEVPYLIDGAADAVILPRDVDSRPALDLLIDVAQDTGAAVFDLPDGTVVYQPMKERARPVKPFRWQDFDSAFMWSQFDSAFTWADFNTWYSTDSEFPVAIPPGAVEYEPAWSSSEADVINHVRIGYGAIPEGSEQAWTEVTSPASIDRHGRRYLYSGTQLRDLADAQAFASWWLAVKGSEHWHLDDIVVRLELLDPDIYAAVMALTCGDHITIDGMPQPAPATVYTGIVEGWTYTMWGAGGLLHERLVLHTTAPLESLAVPQWGDYDDAFMWSDHDAQLAWADMTSPAAIGA